MRHMIANDYYLPKMLLATEQNQQNTTKCDDINPVIITQRIYVGGIEPPNLTVEMVQNRIIQTLASTPHYKIISMDNSVKRSDMFGGDSTSFFFLTIQGPDSIASSSTTSTTTSENDTPLDFLKKQYHNVKWKGCTLKVEVAKMHFLQRLEKERQEMNENKEILKIKQQNDQEEEEEEDVPMNVIHKVQKRHLRIRKQHGEEAYMIDTKPINTNNWKELHDALKKMKGKYNKHLNALVMAKKSSKAKKKKTDNEPTSVGEKAFFLQMEQDKYKNLSLQSKVFLNRAIHLHFEDDDNNDEDGTTYLSQSSNDSYISSTSEYSQSDNKNKYIWSDEESELNDIINETSDTDSSEHKFSLAGNNNEISMNNEKDTKEILSSDDSISSEESIPKDDGKDNMSVEKIQNGKNTNIEIPLEMYSADTEMNENQYTSSSESSESSEPSGLSNTMQHSKSQTAIQEADDTEKFNLSEVDDLSPASFACTSNTSSNDNIFKTMSAATYDRHSDDDSVESLPEMDANIQRIDNEQHQTYPTERSAAIHGKGYEWSDSDESDDDSDSERNDTNNSKSCDSSSSQHRGYYSNDEDDKPNSFSIEDDVESNLNILKKLFPDMVEIKKSEIVNRGENSANVNTQLSSAANPMDETTFSSDIKKSVWNNSLTSMQRYDPNATQSKIFEIKVETKQNDQSHPTTPMAVEELGNHENDNPDESQNSDAASDIIVSNPVENEEKSNESIYEQAKLESIFQQARTNRDDVFQMSSLFADSSVQGKTEENVDGNEERLASNNHSFNTGTSFSFNFDSPSNRVSDHLTVNEGETLNSNVGEDEDSKSLTMDFSDDPQEKTSLSRRKGFIFPSDLLNIYEENFYKLNNGEMLLKNGAYSTGIDDAKNNDQSLWLEERKTLTLDWKRKQKYSMTKKNKRAKK